MEDPVKSTAKKPLTKTEFVTSLAEATELSKQQVTGLLDELSKLIAQNLRDGEETRPGIEAVLPRPPQLRAAWRRPHGSS